MSNTNFEDCSPVLAKRSPNKGHPPSPPAYSPSPTLAFQMPHPPAFPSFPSSSTPTTPYAGPSRLAFEDSLPRHGGRWDEDSPTGDEGGDLQADEAGGKRGSVHDQWFSPGIPKSARERWRSMDEATEKNAPLKRIAMLEKDLANALRREQAGKELLSGVMADRDLAREDAKGLKAALGLAEERVRELEKMVEDLGGGARSSRPPVQASPALRSFVARPSTSSPASSFGRTGFHTPPSGHPSAPSPAMRGMQGERSVLGSPLAPARWGGALPRTPYAAGVPEDHGAVTNSLDPSVSQETATFKTALNISTLTTNSPFLPPRSLPPTPMTAMQSPIYRHHHLPSSLSLASPRTPYATSPAAGRPPSPALVQPIPHPRWERGGYRRESERECESDWSGSSGYRAEESDRAGVSGSPSPGPARQSYPPAYHPPPAAVSPWADSSASILSKGALLRTHGVGGGEYDWLGQTARQRFERWVAEGELEGPRAGAEGGWEVKKTGGGGNVDPWDEGEYTEDDAGLEAGEKRGTPETRGQAGIQHQRAERTIPHRHTPTRRPRPTRKHPRRAIQSAHHRVHPSLRAAHAPRDPLLIRALRAPFILIGMAVVYAARIVAMVMRLWEYAVLFWEEVREGPPGLRPARE